MNLSKQFGFLGAADQNIQALFDFLNCFSEVISFVIVTGGTEVAIPHNMEVIPRHVFPVLVEGATVSFANVFPGTTAWTMSNIYLTASLPGTYHVIIRR